MLCLFRSLKSLPFLILCFFYFSPVMSADAGVSWPNNATTFHIANLNGANDQWKDVFEEAAQRWNDAPTQFNFKVSREPGSGYCTSLGNNNVRFSSTNCGDAWGDSSIGVTAYWSKGTELIKADISFNTSNDWHWYDGNLQSYATDFRRVALHELGHAAGLAHSVDNNVLMSAALNNVYLPALDDINALKDKYGSTTHTLTIQRLGSGIVTLSPKVAGTGVISANTLYTSNYASLLNCYETQCQIAIQHGLRLTMTAVADNEAQFISWDGTIIRENVVELAAMTEDRNIVANFSSVINDSDNDGINDDSDNCSQVENNAQLESDNNGIGEACDSEAQLLQSLPSTKAGTGSLSNSMLIWMLLLALIQVFKVSAKLDRPNNINTN